MLWLNLCIVPSIPQDAITIEVVYPAVLLANGKTLGLLPAMVCKLQNDLWELAVEFCPGRKKKKGRGTELEAEMSTSNPRVELLYTYLIVWFVMYCPSLMISSPEDSSGFHSFKNTRDVIGEATTCARFEDCVQLPELLHLLLLSRLL